MDILGYINIQISYGGTIKKKAIKKKANNFCYLDNLTIEHIMVECQHFAVIRQNTYQINVNDMRDLFQKVSLTCIIRFLRAANLYKEI